MPCGWTEVCVHETERERENLLEDNKKSKQATTNGEKIIVEKNLLLLSFLLFSLFSFPNPTDGTLASKASISLKATTKILYT